MARWRRAGPYRARVRPPPLKSCMPAGLAGPGVTSGDIRVTSRGPWLAQGPRPRATKCPRHPGTPPERRSGVGAGAVWGLGEARTEPRQVPTDAEIGQKQLRCRSEKRSRDTLVTLRAAVKPPAGSLGNPLVALAGWIGQLAPRAVGTRRTA